MRVTIPLLSLVLLLLTGETLARSSFGSRDLHPVKRNATLANMIAKRQTSRNQINMRKHVRETVTRVHKVMAAEREEAITVRMTPKGRPARMVYSNPATPAMTEADLDAIVAAAQSDLEAREPTMEMAEATPVEAREVVVEKKEETPSRVIRVAKRQVTGGGQRRALPAPMSLEERTPTVADETPSKIQRVAKRQVTGGGQRRALPNRQIKREYVEYEERSYPMCPKSGARTGYARYPGWKLAGDELSGALPVKTPAACVQTCNKYGGACSGTFFDSVKSKCYLKGTRTSSWNFAQSDEDDSVDLIGGCALWANIVPEEMDEVCCRD